MQLKKVGAGYGMVKYTISQWELIAGVRIEHTDQGYTLKFLRETPLPKVTNAIPTYYPAFMPNMQYIPMETCVSPMHGHQPSQFFEIVPYSIINEDYKEKGNPELKHTVADNIDLRYEFFPRSSEQLMVGLFYKNIKTDRIWSTQ